jgi:hypothetical protein
VADDDPQLQALDGGAPPSLPVFGKREQPLAARTYRRFGVEIETDSDRFVAEFDAYLDADAGAILGLMNSRTELQQAQAMAVLLGTSLRDDDGVPADWRFPIEPEVDEDSDGEDYLRADPEDGEEEGEPLYRWHDDSLMTADELRDAIAEFDPLEVGSSRRRFQYLADSPRHRMQLAALNDLSQWVIGDAAKRPTRRPTSSGRGPQQTRRTSGGRSR